MRFEHRPQLCVVPCAKGDRLNAPRSKTFKQFRRKKRLAHQVHPQATVLRLDRYDIAASNVDRATSKRKALIFLSQNNQPIDEAAANSRGLGYEEELLNERAATLLPIPKRHIGLAATHCQPGRGRKSESTSESSTVSSAYRILSFIGSLTLCSLSGFITENPFGIHL